MPSLDPPSAGAIGITDDETEDNEWGDDESDGEGGVSLEALYGLVNARDEVLSAKRNEPPFVPPLPSVSVPAPLETSPSPPDPEGIIGGEDPLGSWKGPMFMPPKWLGSREEPAGAEEDEGYNCGISDEDVVTRLQAYLQDTVGEGDPHDMAFRERLAATAKMPRREGNMVSVGKKGQKGDASNVTSVDGEKFEETAADNLLIFQGRVQRCPSQGVRYEWGGRPLWSSKEPPPAASNPPNCPCGAPRLFEMQLMPHLLFALRVDDHFNHTHDSPKDCGMNSRHASRPRDLLREESHAAMDWGTVAVYSCEASCARSNIEFAVVQSAVY
eukprot:CAMPEP_0185751028 /NCGR_PEP_ID=MMETSP1174-20130828/9780_1 /TAXON_ID=35687 /ORGANISM="Dictyocha speculum, Strain CCMP1381" /LENGTH=327 /DNA_ID=CAMNT_0028427811 /DNA_START=27 /DNA_END=1010 /DNA_ORIENTATION=-